MFLPVQEKPVSLIDFTKSMIEIPNLITRDVANELRQYTSSEGSGWHHRGSKTPEICKASFHTCLVFRFDNPIYEILDYAWEKFQEYDKTNLTFIEPYEIKSYSVGDVFEPHNDILYSNDSTVERRVNLVIQLSDPDEYEGGDLLIGNAKCSRELGTGIFFRAETIHSVTEITRGTRFSLIGHAWGPKRI